MNDRMGASNNIPHPHLYMTMSLEYLAIQLDHLETFGFSREEAMTALELSGSAFENPKARIELSRVEHMYTQAAKSLADPRIAMRVGYKFRVHGYKQTGSIYSYCENIAQVLELNSRYQCLAIDIGCPEHHIEDGRHFFCYNRYEAAKDMHHVMGMVFGAWGTAFRWFSWASGHELIEAHLMPKAPKDISFYQEVVQCPILFGMPRNQVEFHPEAITKPLITRDPEKLAQAVTILDKLLGRGNAEENFKATVIATLQAAIADGSVNLSIVAARMNIPEQQLRKRISQLGLSFRTILEGERKHLFQELHAKGESFVSIAQSLAYNDQAAFNRAFKRWYGTSPSRYASNTSETI